MNKASERYEAKEATIEEIIFGNIPLHVPDYQRPYDWEKEQAKALASDLIEAYLEGKSGEEERVGRKSNQENPYFLGSLILHKQEIEDDERYKYESYSIIDGQQRITTLLLILIYISQFLKEEEHTSEIIGAFWLKARAHNKILPKLTTEVNREDKEFYEQTLLPAARLERGGFISFKEGKLSSWANDLVGLHLSLIKKIKDGSNLTESSKKILGNFNEISKVFKEEFPGIRSGEKALDFLNFLKTQVYLIKILSNDFDSAYKIFSIINDRGKPLLNIDIIKAKIFNPRIRNKNSCKKDWEEKVEGENGVSREELNDILGLIITAEKRSKPNKSLIKSFEDLGVVTNRSCKPAVEMFAKYVESYKKITSPLNYFKSDPNYHQHQEVPLTLLNLLSFKDWMIPVLFILDNNKYKGNKKLNEVKKSIGIAQYKLLRLWEIKVAEEIANNYYEKKRVNEAILFVNKINGLISSGEIDPQKINKIFLDDVIPDRNKLIDTITDFLNRESENFYSLASNKRNFFLYRMDIPNENIGGGNISVERLYSNDITIEHILPRKVLRKFKYDSEVNWENYPWTLDEGEKYINHLGNITLLEKSLNSNRREDGESISKKLEIYNKSQYYMTRDVKVIYLDENKSWSPLVIEKRANILKRKYISDINDFLDNF